MPMCVIVTRDVPARFRGFLASCMLEIAPGVYTQPDMSASVRERVWAVLRRTGGPTTARGLPLLTWAAPNTPERPGRVATGRTLQGFGSSTTGYMLSGRSHRPDDLRLLFGVSPAHAGMDRACASVSLHVLFLQFPPHTRGWTCIDRWKTT